MKCDIKITSLPVSTGRAEIKCASCAMNKLCLPTGLDESDIGRLDKIISRRRRIERGDTLFSMDQPFRHLYAVRFGHFKTFRINPNGEQQVVGFHMAGELLGMDGIGTDRHNSCAEALEDSEICEIPFSQLGELFGQIPTLQRHFHRIMSHEITREQGVMMFLGGMRAEQRFAIFLLNMAMRYAARGYSSSRFQLRMSREEIGNYLGLTIESVSRLLLRFKEKGWVSVDKREVELRDRASIEALASGMAPAEPIVSRRPSRPDVLLAAA